jgi:NAD-dependent protein deacetylase/lipoamidase
MPARIGAVLETLIERLRRAQRVTVMTGAGVSAASGVPTFRGASGLWRSFRAEELATPDAFDRDPALVWEWYEWRRATIASCVPNAAHDVLAQWTHASPGCTVITQNVDDLHLRAGTQRLVRLHGSIWELACWNDCGKGPWRDDRVPLPNRLPTCDECGGLARPGVVWFGESLSDDDLSAAAMACACDVFIAVGTSAVVYPAAGLLHQAKAHGAFTAEINLEATSASPIVDLAIQQAAEIALPHLASALRNSSRQA